MPVKGNPTSSTSPLNLPIRLVLLLLPAAFLLVGISISIWIVPRLASIQSSRTWPTVPARIHISRVEEQASQDPNNGRPMYAAILRYTYQIDGREYASGDVSLADYSSSDWEEINRIVTHYPVGQVVTAHYNPVNPHQAVLEPGFSPGMIIGSIIALAFLAAGILFGILAILLFRPVRHPPTSEQPSAFTE